MHGIAGIHSALAMSARHRKPAQTARIQLGELSVGFVHPLVLALEALGHDAEPLLQRFGLGKERLASAGSRISIPHYMRLSHAAIELSGRPDLGLLMGRHSRMEQLGLAGACARLAPDGRSATRDLTRFEPLHARNYLGQSSLDEQREGSWINFYSIAPYNGYNRFVVDTVLAAWPAYLQQVTGQPATPQRVQIEYPAPAHAAVFEEYFGCPVEFSAPANRILYRHQVLNRPNPFCVMHSWHELQGLCRQQLQLQQLPARLTEQLARQIAQHLRQGEPSLTEMARRLRMPAWTLQRRLEQEGSSFRQLVQETRHGLALSYLRDTRLSLAEIAWQLGFASSEAFQRAFKRWQGLPPGQFRQQADSAEHIYSTDL